MCLLCGQPRSATGARQDRGCWAQHVSDRRDSRDIRATARCRSSERDRLEERDSLLDRRMGVEEMMEPTLVMPQGVIDAHCCSRMIEAGEWFIVGPQLPQRIQQPRRVASELHAADVCQ